MEKLKILFQIAIIFFPWQLRRWLLVRVMKYEIHPSAWIGKAIICPRKLVMAEHSKIGHGTIARGLEEVRLERFAKIGKLNWISGFPLGGARFFKAFPDRYPQLHLHEHAIIVNRNLIDCTDRITVGKFSLIAGNGQQILTHSIDLRTANQSCAPVEVGQYCLIGTRSILLKGSALPDFSVLGAGSVLHKKNTQQAMLYSGVPAIAVREIDKTDAFFKRQKGDSD